MCARARVCTCVQGAGGPSVTHERGSEDTCSIEGGGRGEQGGQTPCRGAALRLTLTNTHTHIDTVRETHTHTETQSETHVGRHTHIDTQSEKHTHKDTHTYSTQSERHKVGDTHT